MNNNDWPHIGKLNKRPIVPRDHTAVQHCIQMRIAFDLYFTQVLIANIYY